MRKIDNPTRPSTLGGAVLLALAVAIIAVLVWIWTPAQIGHAATPTPLAHCGLAYPTGPREYSGWAADSAQISSEPDGTSVLECHGTLLDELTPLTATQTITNTSYPDIHCTVDPAGGPGGAGLFFFSSSPPGKTDDWEETVEPDKSVTLTCRYRGQPIAGTTITIPQLQIQLTVPSDLSDLTWTVYGQQEARFSTKKLEAKGPYCNSIYGPLGIARISGAQNEDFIGEVVATFTHSYLYYAHAQATCSADTTATDLQTQQSIELRAALGAALHIGPSPEITSDIVLVVNDTYHTGDIASISIRNDGQVSYKYNPRQEACEFTYNEVGSGRQFQIPPATHCDLPGDDAEIAPGETVAVVQWSLDECFAPGFFCLGVRPLPTDYIRISGALDSADGLKRAQFSKTVSITGPHFTSDIELSFYFVVTDPPTGKVLPVYLQLRNMGQIDYSVPVRAACYLAFKNPAGNLIVIPPATTCDSADQVTLTPGDFIDAVRDWKSDVCTQVGPSSCLTAEPLPPGDYVISGALWSADKQSYAEFSKTLTISARAPSQTVSPTPKVLPRDGGPPAGESTPWVLVAGGLAAIFGIACVAFAARKDEARHER